MSKRKTVLHTHVMFMKAFRDRLRDTPYTNPVVETITILIRKAEDNLIHEKEMIIHAKASSLIFHRRTRAEKWFNETFENYVP